MSALFGKMPKKPETVRMPDPEGAEGMAAMEAKRRQIAARSSRANTVLSRGAGGEGGTRSYGNSLLGQAG
jgi:hypothetical protein